MYVAGIRCCLVSKQANQSPTATKASSSKAETKTTRHDAEGTPEAVAEVSDTEEIECKEITLNVASIERNHRYDVAVHNSKTILYFMKNEARHKTPPGTPLSMADVGVDT